MIEQVPLGVEFADFAASRIAEALDGAVRQRGQASIALAGGSTPEGAYRRLAALKVDWSRIVVFLSDERFVPLDDSRSNLGMAKRALLDHILIPPRNLFGVNTKAESAARAAEQYEATILEVLGDPPRFDLILLGLGDDGHTASLFPGAPSLDVIDRWVVSSPPGALPPPVDRITFTYPTLNAARQVFFLVSGDKKARVLQEVLEEKPRCQLRPAACVRPNDGEVRWLVDRSAARLLRSLREAANGGPSPP